ncbi:hypothetical protein [Amycolatopsis sp. NPDC049159]|uniref:hypothetical protein n=1 Tax=Amycolatopsis sp. NPDC049159 TaxID=3157210 RepID=UPI0033C65E48
MIGPDRAIAVGAAVARGSVGVWAVQVQTDRPAQVLAIKTTTGGDLVKLTYVAQVGTYVVTAFALCGKQPICEAALNPVLADGAARARAA